MDESVAVPHPWLCEEQVSGKSSTPIVIIIIPIVLLL
jgi:hypothetical protein